MKKVVSIFILGCFFVTSIMGPDPVYAQEFRLPAPGVMVHLSPEFNPPILKGIKVHPKNPFHLDFILDQGDRSSDPKEESTRLIKYFLASLTIPEKDLWVNLSPYEKNRIVPESFGQTEMGRDLLAEDYMLKQITASLIYPEDEIGKKFWQRIYEEAVKKFGTTNIPVNTFNKVWIVPDKAVVYENAKTGTAYIIESKLKVMLEEDYLSLQKHRVTLPLVSRYDTHSLGVNIVREIVIPELTKEVNEGHNFAQLRQVYNSLILAAWYKKKIKDSILAQVYADKNKIVGVGYKNSHSYGIEGIYQRYLLAFKKGVFNYIKEEPDPMAQGTIPRKYFSGGASFYRVDAAMTLMHHFNSAQLTRNDLSVVDVRIDSAMLSPFLSLHQALSKTMSELEVNQQKDWELRALSGQEVQEASEEGLQQRLSLIWDWVSQGYTQRKGPQVLRYQVGKSTLIGMARKLAGETVIDIHILSSPRSESVKEINTLISRITSPEIRKELRDKGYTRIIGDTPNKFLLATLRRKGFQNADIPWFDALLVAANYFHALRTQGYPLTNFMDVKRVELALVDQEFNWQMLEREGYSIEEHLDKTRVQAPEVLIVTLKKDGQEVKKAFLSFEIFPSQQIIRIQFFGPEFPKDKVGRGRALLRHILDPYKNYHIVADNVSAEFRSSLRKMQDYQMEESEGRLGLIAREEFAQILSSDSFRQLSIYQQRWLRNTIRDSKIHGKVPAQAAAAVQRNSAMKVVSETPVNLERAELMTLKEYNELQQASEYRANSSAVYDNLSRYGINLADLYDEVLKLEEQPLSDLRHSFQKRHEFDAKAAGLVRMRYREEFSRLLLRMNMDPDAIRQAVEGVSKLLFHLAFTKHNLDLRKGKIIKIRYTPASKNELPKPVEVVGILTDARFDDQKGKVTVTLNHKKPLVLSLKGDNEEISIYPEIEDVVKIKPVTNLAMTSMSYGEILTGLTQHLRSRNAAWEHYSKAESFKHSLWDEIFDLHLKSYSMYKFVDDRKSKPQKAKGQKGFQDFVRYYDEVFIVRDSKKNIAAFMLAKRTPFGIKINLVGNNGDLSSKVQLLDTLEHLDSPGVYMEISGKLEQYMLSFLEDALVDRIKGEEPRQNIAIVNPRLDSILKGDDGINPDIDGMHFERLTHFDQKTVLVRRVFIGRPLLKPRLLQRMGVSSVNVPMEDGFLLSRFYQRVMEQYGASPKMIYLMFFMILEVGKNGIFNAKAWEPKLKIGASVKQINREPQQFEGFLDTWRVQVLRASFMERILLLPDKLKSPDRDTVLETVHMLEIFVDTRLTLARNRTNDKVFIKLLGESQRLLAVLRARLTDGSLVQEKKSPAPANGDLEQRRELVRWRDFLDFITGINFDTYNYDRNDIPAFELDRSIDHESLALLLGYGANAQRKYRTLVSILKHKSLIEDIRVLNYEQINWGRYFSDQHQVKDCLFLVPTREEYELLRTIVNEPRWLNFFSTLRKKSQIYIKQEMIYLRDLEHKTSDVAATIDFVGRKIVMFNPYADYPDIKDKMDVLLDVMSSHGWKFKLTRLGAGDYAMKPEEPKTGGIDFTAANMNLQTQNAGEGIKFHLDPALLAQLKNAPGFVPVIINIQPMTNLRMFLGINDPVAVDKSA